jgi:hypothetical protein
LPSARGGEDATTILRKTGGYPSGVRYSSSMAGRGAQASRGCTDSSLRHS